MVRPQSQSGGEGKTTRMHVCTHTHTHSQNIPLLQVGLVWRIDKHK